ncbi:MAG: phosphoribosyltransferase [Vicinamibacterales bacterium]
MLVNLPSLPFANRAEAGVALASQLQHYAGHADVIVLGLPRGGVPIAATVARTLGARFDVFVVRKLGVPGHRELAMGAIASGGAQVLNQGVIDALHLTDRDVRQVAAEEQRELRRRELAYRGDRPPVALSGQVVVLVDDGLATGSTMLAAVQAIRLQKPRRIVVAVPVASQQASARLRQAADEVVCVRVPKAFSAVGEWYIDFAETSDDEVREALKEAAAETAPIKLP